MDTVTLVAFILSFYLFMWFCNSIFKSCMMYPYIRFLKETGLRVGFLRISWQTTAFNKRLMLMGRKCMWFSNIWFTIGAIATVILLPVALTIIIQTGLVNMIKTEKTSNYPVIEPIIPGVNLPSGDFVFYVISLILCTVFHELGHALAAARDNVQILSVGFNVVFLLPIAYVIMNSSHLEPLSTARKLKIYCAGVWHNIVLAVISIGLLSLVPHFFAYGYRMREGVQIVAMHPKSPLFAAEGLAVGDLITKVNQHYIRSRYEWDLVFTNMLKEQFGFCVTADFVHQNDESIGAKHQSNDLIDCCADGKGNVCFEFIESEFSVVRLPQHMCLPARKVTSYGFGKCSADDNYYCDPDYDCIKPLIVNTTSFIIIERSDKNDVLYLGYPSDVYRTIAVSEYVPRTWFLPASLPQDVVTLLQYILIFTCGLSMINVMPCYGFDGQYISSCVIGYIIRKRIRNRVMMIYLFCGTAITVLSLVFAVSKAVMDAL